MNGDTSRAEYEALRATIRERGTRRVTLFVLSMAVWALIFVLGLQQGGRFATFGALMVLVAGFEAVYALHVGVERIGRYLQVFYEEAGHLPAWERTAMAFGREPSGDGIDPLFSLVYAAALLLNLVPVGLTGQPVFILAAGAAHAGFALRILRTRLYAAAQRAKDLERFRRLKDSG
ncbi:MAG TPA: hypothetical protein VH702_14740 [Vicinamibacterales bacterium]|jgi:hypothetical protein